MYTAHPSPATDPAGQPRSPDSPRDAASPRRIVIVGGVAGGMSCAARARRLDESASIVVLERGKHVSFANCGLPYYVGGEITDPSQLLVQTPGSLHAALNLDVRIEHDVTALDPHTRELTVSTPDGVRRIGYDALVLSPGARAVLPPVPGLAGSRRATTLRSVDDAIGMRTDITSGARNAVVLGAGFIGLEAAEALVHQGLSVTLIELADHLLPPLEAELAALVTDEARLLGIDVRTSVAATSVTSGPDRDVITLSDGSRLPAELVVVAAGVRPDTAAFEAAGIACERGAILVDDHGRTSHDGIWAVGDATASIDAVTGARRPVALAGPANRAGRLVADDILRPGSARRIPPPVATAIVRLGGITAAITGANRAALDAAGRDYRTIHVHPHQHAGYFPGAMPIHLVVHFRTDDGALLGAQAVGGAGVDKRIDVLATAIRAGLAVDDLIDLDLAYSPPYGQAKDPVNLVGMLGENVRSGILRLWYADELARWKEQALLLDTRTSTEFASWHVPGAVNIPHTQLREHLPQVIDLAAGRPVRVMCASGVRSAIAHRVLAQAGLDSASLSGGILTLRASLGGQASAAS